MELTAGTLNRTLLARQHLLERTPSTVPAMVAHLVGLQAQEGWSPYWGLAARLAPFDPEDVTRGLEGRSLVRLLTMRSTVHLLDADDALGLRWWTRPIHERERRVGQNVRAAADVDLDAFAAALRRALADGPLPVKALGERLTATFPGVPANALGGLARVTAPLVQVPPRGCWKQPGGVVYQYVDAWVGRPTTEPDPAELARRYFRALGPASAADLTTWSGVTGMPALLASMNDLVRHTDDGGRRLFDVPEGVLTPAEVPAPVRLLGQYDNVWLSHAGRDRVTTPAKRQRWMGVNGGVANTVFVDGRLEGLWRVADRRPVVIDLFRDLTRAERTDLDDELDRVATLLAR